MLALNLSAELLWVHSMKFSYKLFLFLIAICLSACGNSTQPELSSVEKQEEIGRTETQTIRSTEKIGYAGDAVSAKVDAALDANDQRMEKLDKEIDE